jgi:HemK-related putative methylase
MIGPLALALRALDAARRRFGRPLLFRLRRPLVLARIARPSEVRLLGHRLRTHPDVFDPVCFSSSRVLAERLLERPLRGLRVLDMGTGAGPVAVAVASAGAIVTACDINPRAAALAGENFLLNGLGSEVIESDLFAALGGRTFDLICFNIPFFARDPVTHLEAAFYAGRDLETVRRFAQGCTEHLSRQGRVVIVFSEDCDERAIIGAFEGIGFSVESQSTARRLLELFYVVWFQRGECITPSPITP